MFDELVWRLWRCPRDLESAARDFLVNRNGPGVRAVLAQGPWSEEGYPRTDFKRLIVHTYGPARVEGRSGEVWKPGWNRRLLAACGGDPERATELILERVCELAREESLAMNSGGACRENGLTEEQTTEIDRRLQDAEESPEDGFTWEENKADALQRARR